VLIGECRCRVIAVSANSTLVDVSNVSGTALGDEAVLIGKQGAATVTAYEVAQSAGSVYRLLTGVPRAVPRIWV